MSTPINQAFEDFLNSLGVPITPEARTAFDAFWQQTHPQPTEDTRQGNPTSDDGMDTGADDSGKGHFNMKDFARAFAQAIPQPIPINYSALSAALISGQRAAQASDVPMEKMEPWGGERDKLDEFISQCELRFLAKPYKYSNAEAQILFATGVLTGTPRKLVDEERKLHPTLQGLWIHSWPEFVAQLRGWFGDADPRAAARNKLQNLKQTQSVLKYWTDFAVIATKLPWDDEAKKDIFYVGLKSEIKDELARLIIPPATLLELKDYAVRIDTRLYQRNFERRHEDRSSDSRSHDGNKSKGKDFKPFKTQEYRNKNGYQASFASSGKSPYTAPVSVAVSTGPQPMDIDAVFQGKVTPAEKDRRQRLGLCAYDGCDKPGDCRKLKSKDQDGDKTRKYSTRGVHFSVSGPDNGVASE
jgi:hypothetical protein